MIDQWPKLRKRKSLVTLVTCAAMFILGLPLCTDVSCNFSLKQPICTQSNFNEISRFNFILCNRFHFINREVHIYCNWWTVMQEVGMSWCLLSLNVSALDTSMVNISRLFDFIQLFHCSKRGIIWIYSNRKNCWKLSVIINGEIYVNLFCAITRMMSDLGAFKFREDIGVILGKESCGCFPWTICSWWWIVNWCIFTPAGKMQSTGIGHNELTKMRRHSWSGETFCIGSSQGDTVTLPVA